MPIKLFLIETEKAGEREQGGSARAPDGGAPCAVLHLAPLLAVRQVAVAGEPARREGLSRVGVLRALSRNNNKQG